MNEDLLRRIRSLEPPFEEIEMRSDRARRRALAELGEPAAVGDGRRFRVPALAVAAGVLVVAAVLFRPVQRPPAPPAEALESSPAASPPLRVYLTLSDGTKVVWVLDEHYAM